MLESKIREHLNAPRTLTNRAQSLDLSYSLSKIAEGHAPRPDSPATSAAGDTTGGNSPTSATPPLFPSVYGHRSHVIGSAGHLSGNNLLDEEAAAEVSRVMSNLGL